MKHFNAALIAGTLLFGAEQVASQEVVPPKDHEITTIQEGSSSSVEQVCSGHGHLHEDHCHCDEGYSSQGDTCVPN